MQDVQELDRIQEFQMKVLVIVVFLLSLVHPGWLLSGAPSQ